MFLLRGSLSGGTIGIAEPADAIISLGEGSGKQAILPVKAIAPLGEES
jgi:hypothetical protein